MDWGAMPPFQVHELQFFSAIGVGAAARAAKHSAETARQRIIIGEMQRHDVVATVNYSIVLKCPLTRKRTADGPLKQFRISLLMLNPFGYHRLGTRRMDSSPL
jgi:hypothetical protein